MGRKRRTLACKSRRYIFTSCLQIYCVRGTRGIRLTRSIGQPSNQFSLCLIFYSYKFYLLHCFDLQNSKFSKYICKNISNISRAQHEVSSTFLNDFKRLTKTVKFRIFFCVMFNILLEYHCKICRIIETFCFERILNF